MYIDESSSAKRPLILYFGSGGMSGVFSLGVAKAIKRAGLMNQISAIYGNSAGAIATLYFLSNKIESGLSMFTRDLNGRKHIKWDRVTRYLLKGFYNFTFGQLIGKLNVDPFIDIDYVEHIINNKYHWSFNEMQKTGVRFFVTGYNLDKKSHDFMEIKGSEDILPMLKATAGAQPAYHKSVIIDGNHYIDSAAVDSDYNRIQTIIERHPDKEILCILTSYQWHKSKISIVLYKIAVAIMLLPFFGFSASKELFFNISDFTDLEELKMRYPNVFFITNDIQDYQLVTIPKKVKSLYYRGYELCKYFILMSNLKITKFNKELARDNLWKRLIVK